MAANGGEGGNELYVTEWRWARLRISPQFLIDSLKISRMLASNRMYRVAMHALPEDAKFIRIDYDHMAGCMWMVIESSTFEALHDGDLIPELKSPIIETE